jgi:hypothetical protein
MSAVEEAGPQTKGKGGEVWMSNGRKNAIREVFRVIT